jgi:hypothetical protein
VTNSFCDQENHNFALSLNFAAIIGRHSEEKVSSANVKLTCALQDENDRTVSYKEFMAIVSY